MKRILLYSFDNGTLGHARRTVNIAGAICRRCEKAIVLVVGNSSFYGKMGLPKRAELLRLPSLARERSEKATYVSSSWGNCGEWFWKMRQKILRETILAMEPDAILVDYKAPGVNGELIDGLEAIKSAKPACRIFFGLRDLPDSPEKRKPNGGGMEPTTS